MPLLILSLSWYITHKSSETFLVTVGNHDVSFFISILSCGKAVGRFLEILKMKIARILAVSMVMKRYYFRFSYFIHDGS